MIRAVYEKIPASVRFAVLAVALVGVTYTPLAWPFNEALCALSFRGTRAVMEVLGIGFTAIPVHRIFTHGGFAIEVNGLCSGMRGVAIFVAAVVLLPMSWRRRLVQILIGTVVLTLVNVARIAHLFWLGAGGSTHFSLWHEWVWPMAILNGIVLYRYLRLSGRWPTGRPGTMVARIGAGA